MSKKPTYEELEQRANKLEQEAVKHKQAEEALRESEERYRTLFYDLADPVLIFRGKEPNTILDCNKAMVEKYGY
jgi:PAS domain-containing protein